MDQNFNSIKQESKVRLQKNSQHQKHASTALSGAASNSRQSQSRKKSLPHISTSSNEDRETAQTYFQYWVNSGNQFKSFDFFTELFLTSLSKCKAQLDPMEP